MTDKFEETARDLLVELRADMKHVRSTVDSIKTSDGKQWDKLDEHSVALEGNKKSINYLAIGMRIVYGTAATVIGGIIVGVIVHFFRRSVG